MVQVFFSRYLSVTWTGLPSRKLVVSPICVHEEDVLLSDEGKEKFECVCVCVRGKGEGGRGKESGEGKGGRANKVITYIPK